MGRTAITKNRYLVRVRVRVGVGVVVLLLLTASNLAAQDRGPLLLRLPASTRALAMGNTFAVGSTDSDGLFYNAAFPDRLRGVGAAVQRWSERATLYTMSGAVDWWSGALAIGVRALDYGGGVDGQVAAGPAVHEGELQARRAGSIAERAASLSYARRVKAVRGAVTAHVVEQRTSVEQNAFAAADIALGYESGFFAVGLAARNIGASYELEGVDIDLPLQFQLSAAGLRPLPVAGLDVLPVAALMYELDGDVIPSGGVEVSYWPVQGRTFSLRIGARRAPPDVRPFTAGAGFSGDRLILDYAIVPLENDRFVHRFGVRWR